MGKVEELVQESGVSRSTVFRFLRGESVRARAKDSIVAAMEKLDIPYEHRPSAPGGVLQIAIRSHHRAFKGYGLAISGFMKRAEQNGFTVQLRAGHPQDLEARRRRPRDGEEPAGVIVLGMTMEEEEFEIRKLREQRIPHVFVNRMFEDPSVSWVSCDLPRAAKEATEHLLSLGHREIGNWGVTETIRIDRLKRSGYMEALEEAGVFRPEFALEMHRHGDLEDAIHTLIEAGRLPSAWFCSSDEHALRLIRAVRKKGLRIPEDLAVVGMDAVDDGEFTYPSLTTVGMPFDEEGEIAFEVLKRLMDNPGEVSVRVVLKHRLIVRESCGTALLNQESGPPGREG